MNLYENILKYENSKLNALYYNNKTISYKKLMINIRKMANYLSFRGIKRGDVVTVVLPNIPTTIYAFYALNALGVIQNIIHPLTFFENIIKSMKETNSNNVILLSTYYQENKSLIDELDYNFFFANPMNDNSLIEKYGFYLKYEKPKENNNIHLIDKFISFKEIDKLETLKSEDTSIYLHSGGTTGIAKTICLSCASINNLVGKMNNIVLDKIEGKSMLAVLPIFHGFGLGMGVHAPLSNGAASFLMMKFNAKKVIKYINKNRINFIIGVPLLYQKLLKEPMFHTSKLSNLECAFIGGDNVNINLINQFNNLMKEKNSKCRMYEGYGLTETVTVCSVNTPKNYKIGSVGKALDNLELLILDEEMKIVDNNIIGEVYVGGDTLMNGYLNDEHATLSTIVKINDKYYIRTGDLGYIDDDGFLFLKGRKKRMFKINGINVYPNEVEKIAMENINVFDASLEYFDDPSPSLALYIIKNNNIEISEEKINKEIIDMLKKRVLKYSLPKEIIFVNEFPKTDVGKIDHKSFDNPFKK